MISKIGYLLLLFAIRLEQINAKISYLEPGEVANHPTSNEYRQNYLDIYCYKGKPKYIIYIWQTVVMKINCKNENYVQYDGTSPSEVESKFAEHVSSWSINLFAWKQKKFTLNPFNESCVGIDSKENYSISLSVIRVDYWKVLLLLFGITLFLSSERLSKNTLFYYICGVSFGICASFLILIYFISKLFPKKPMMYGAVVCGWTVGIYILQMLWENIRTILMNYQNYVAWYILITGLISFIVCYRWGPVTNQRTRNLIRWSLKVCAMVCIYFSSQFQEAAMGQIVILVLSHNFPKSWVTKSKTYWKRKFPPKVKLLSEDEYHHQGVLETSKALEELRQYCSSPKCNQWNTVLKIKDVRRFASFVEGNSHLSDNEILEYESSFHQTDLTDDEEDMSITDEED